MNDNENEDDFDFDDELTPVYRDGLRRALEKAPVVEEVEGDEMDPVL